MSIKSKAAGLIAFIVPAVYYYLNGYPGLWFIDSGELALSSYLLGIAHPTGYPLYSLIARIFTLFGERPIEAVNLFAAISTAGAIYIFYLILTNIKSVIAPDRDRLNIIPLLASMILALAPVIANQGLVNEVYGLGLLLNLLTIYSALKSLVCTDPRKAEKYLYLTWFMTGLSLCNHLNSIQLLPGLVILTILLMRRYHLYRLLLTAPIFILIPLTAYLSLPIRSAMIPPPVADWGDVTSWGNFYRHVSGWQFHVWIFSSNAVEVWTNFKSFLGIIKEQYPWPLLLLIPLGFQKLESRLPGLFYFVLLALLVNIGFGINYSIPDISAYYLMSVSLILVLIVAGVYYFESSKLLILTGSVIVTIIVGWQIYQTTPENYKADQYLAEDFALNLARSADYNGTILSEIWDQYGQLLYLQQAEQLRPDLKLIDKELLRRSWYYKNLKTVYPELFSTIADLVPPFLKELAVFESGGEFNPARLEKYYQAIINRIIIKNRPCFIDYRLRYTPEGNQYLIPQGLLFRVETTSQESMTASPELIWRGKGLGSYQLPKEINHVRNIRQMVDRQRK